MPVSRRTFLASTATIGGALSLGLPSLVQALDTRPTSSGGRLRAAGWALFRVADDLRPYWPSTTTRL